LCVPWSVHQLSGVHAVGPKAGGCLNLFFVGNPAEGQYHNISTSIQHHHLLVHCNTPESDIHPRLKPSREIRYRHAFFTFWPPAHRPWTTSHHGPAGGDRLDGIGDVIEWHKTNACRARNEENRPKR
jgi:hypothetical protein